MVKPEKRWDMNNLEKFEGLGKLLYYFSKEQGTFVDIIGEVILFSALDEKEPVEYRMDKEECKHYEEYEVNIDAKNKYFKNIVKKLISPEIIEALQRKGLEDFVLVDARRGVVDVSKKTARININAVEKFNKKKIATEIAEWED